ncbi:MAG: nucleotidyltransferase domain-containing protein [Calditrichia bacterium]|nr:nucleotidyltransferase domain-containing protein [Calditrichia bacterium]
MNQFLMNPDKEFYLRQISTIFKLSPRQVSLELQNLEKIDLIRKRISGKQHYYSINEQHPLFENLKNIFLKTVGLKDVIKNYLDVFTSEIVFAFIYGSMAKGNAAAESDVDLMIIGNLSTRKVSGSMLQAGNELKREVNFSIFSLNEFKDRLKNNDHFISTVMKEPKIFIIKDLDEFERLAKEWMAAATSNKS